MAENRGKTLYCGIDQSDTFGKAETWQAGKDRNERDDTVYWGERGSFRGFIAAQEGWLTDGESGITGQSIAVIFEFPKEQRRTKRVKRRDIANDADRFPITAAASCGQVGGLICSEEMADNGLATGQLVNAQRNARYYAVGQTGSVHQWTLDWRTNLITRTGDADREATPDRAWWQAAAKTAASRACRAQGYRTATNVVVGPGHDNDKGTGIAAHGDNLGWFYGPNLAQGSDYRFKARQSRTWAATCKKVIRRSR